MRFSHIDDGVSDEAAEQLGELPIAIRVVRAQTVAEKFHELRGERNQLQEMVTGNRFLVDCECFVETFGQYYRTVNCKAANDTYSPVRSKIFT